MISTANGKAAGSDKICPEMIKHGGEEMLEQLTKLCNKVWLLGRVPKEWRNGIIIPLPKKGDIRECSNWRGITFLSTPGKIMATVILNRMRDAMSNTTLGFQIGHHNWYAVLRSGQ